MTHRILTRIIILINLFFLTGVCDAQQHVQAGNADKQQIRVGIFHNYPIVYESDGLLTGFHLELLKEVAKQEGWLLDFKFSGSTSPSMV